MGEKKTLTEMVAQITQPLEEAHPYLVGAFYEEVEKAKKDPERSEEYRKDAEEAIREALPFLFTALHIGLDLEGLVQAAVDEAASEVKEELKEATVETGE